MDRDRVLEPNWIVWPHAHDAHARLLPLTTGIDWDLGSEAFSVRESGGGQALLNAAGLANRGLFAARARVLPGRRLVPLAREGGALPVDAIALCATGAEPVREATEQDLADPDALIVAMAPDGETVVRARKLVTGRTLLVELPSAGKDWSRFHLFGSGWPKDATPSIAGVPGLVPARDVPRLLARPPQVAWVPRAPLLYREADRWLVPARSGFATWAVVVLSLLAGGLALFELSVDRKRLTTTIATRLALAVPAAILLSPTLAAGFGPELAPLAVLVLLAAFGLGIWGVSRVRGDRAAVALVSGIGVLAAGWAPPTHPWSGVLRDLPGGLSPEAIGAAVLYGATGIAATRDGEGLPWLLMRLTVVGALLGLALHAPAAMVAIPIGWAAGVGALPPTVFPALVAAPAGLARLFTGGIDFRPYDLVRGADANGSAEPVANLWHLAAFAFSIPTLAFGFAVAFAALTSASYAGYRLRRAPHGAGGAALTAAGGLAAVAALSPELWPGALIVVAGGLPLLLADAR